ncbi:hypothetical protein ACJX0J_008647, partial [Zea mays]
MDGMETSDAIFAESAIYYITKMPRQECLMFDGDKLQRIQFGREYENDRVSLGWEFGTTSFEGFLCTMHKVLDVNLAHVVGHKTLATHIVHYWEKQWMIKPQ